MKKYYLFTLVSLLAHTSYGQLFQANISNSTSLVHKNTSGEDTLIATFKNVNEKKEMTEKMKAIQSYSLRDQQFTLINPAVVVSVENKQFDLNLGFSKNIATELNKMGQPVNLTWLGNIRAGGQLDGDYKEILTDQNFAGGVKILGSMGLQFKKLNKKQSSTLTNTYYLHFTYKERKFKYLTDTATASFEGRSTPLTRIGFGFSKRKTDWFDLHTLLDISYSFIVHDNFEQLAEHDHIEKFGSGDKYIQRETSVYLGNYKDNVNLHTINFNIFLAKKKGAKVGLLLNPEVIYSVDNNYLWSNIHATLYLYIKKKSSKNEKRFPFKPDLGISLSFNDAFRSRQNSILDDSRWVFGVTKAFYFKEN